jgi:soluble cytochrome b562
MAEEALQQEEELTEVELPETEEDQEEEVVEDDQPQEESKPEEDKKESDEIEDYSEGVKKRIAKLTYKIREAERREQAAVDYAKSVQDELNKTRS